MATVSYTTAWDITRFLGAEAFKRHYTLGEERQVGPGFGQ